MEDGRIIELYHSRSEQAIGETERKYGKYCYHIAYNILRNAPDSEECVNDTYMRAWQTMPPQKPNKLSVFLGKITRNLALDRYKFLRAEKRGGGQVELALEELRLASAGSMDMIVEEIVLVQTPNRFLAGLSTEARILFMGRYWYLRSIKDIAQRSGLSESKIKMSLMRSRNKLKSLLEKEGIAL